MRLAMSAAAAGLLRSLLRRAAVDRDRILLTEFRSTDWQSFRLRIPAPGAREVAARLVNGLGDAEFTVPGHVVADITLAGEPEEQADGSITLLIEALTVEE